MSKPILNIFMYHRILPVPQNGEVSVKQFSKQLDYIATHYNALNNLQFMEFLQGEYTSKKPAALVTFDDGWLDNWLIATPILKEKKIPAMLACSTEFVVNSGMIRDMNNQKDIDITRYDGSYRALYEKDFTPFVTWDEIQAMCESGVWNIQAHGHTHRATYYNISENSTLYPHKADFSLRFALGREPFAGIPSTELASALACQKKELHPQLIEKLQAVSQGHQDIIKSQSDTTKDVETLEEFKIRVKKDMQANIELIAKHVGKKPDFFFWPWGHYSKESLEVAGECGFRCTFSTQKGYVVPGENKNPLCRIGVGEKWKKFLRNSITYRSKVLTGIHDIISPYPSGLRTNK